MYRGRTQTDYPNKALQYKPNGRRNIGRPRKRWRDQLHLEDQGTGLNNILIKFFLCFADPATQYNLSN